MANLNLGVGVSKQIYGVVTAVLLLLALNVGVVLILTWPVTEFSVAKAGSFGDSFGWLNAVFSGFAFLGVMWTLAHQRDELRDSQQAARIERFEGTFFRLLDLYRKNLEEIRIAVPDGGQPIYGVEALMYCCRRVVGSMEEHKKWLPTPNGRLVYERLLQQAARNMTAQARYLGTLETLLESIERDLATPELRTPYWDILAQQLTSSEIKYILLWTLRGHEGSSLSQHISRSPPILGRFAEVSKSGSQRSLFKRIYGVELAQPAANSRLAIGAAEYKRIRRLAVEELQELELRRLSDKATESGVIDDAGDTASE